MTLSEAVLGLLLVASLIGLGAAALRLASLLAPAGLERAVSCAVLAAALAVLETLALGLAGLGGSPVPLTAAALLTWCAARFWLPAPERSPLEEMLGAWAALSTLSRIFVGAIGGLLLAVCLTLLHRPDPGFDGIVYHIPEVVYFVQSGHPGAVTQSIYGLPVGNYPLTNEVLLAWLTGISRGFAALTLWSQLSGVLLVAAGWLMLRELEVPPAIRTLGLAATMIGPLFMLALGQPGTDLPSLTWLVCCSALCLAARKRPLLLAPAIVALGLGIGTKSTVGLIGVLAIGFGLWSARAKLRAIAAPLMLAVVAALAVGGVWYVRNLIEHGSPFWPFYSTPWGDPVPPLLRILSVTMAERLRSTLFDHLSLYVAETAGSIVLLIGGILVAGLSRRRRPVIAAGVVAIAAIAWANSPATGLPNGGLFFGAVGSTIRYLMPAFTAGMVALALAASDGGRVVRVVALATLTGALVWALFRNFSHQFYLPFTTWLAPAALAGGVAGGLASPHVARVIRVGRLMRSRAGSALVSLAATLTGALVLAAGSAGYIARDAKVAGQLGSPVVAFLASQPGFSTGHRPVATSPSSLGLLAGNQLGHRLTLIGINESCSSVRSRARRGWVVIDVVEAQPLPGFPTVIFPFPGTAQGCLASMTPLYFGGGYAVYGPRAAR